MWVIFLRRREDRQLKSTRCRVLCVGRPLPTRTKETQLCPELTQWDDASHMASEISAHHTRPGG